MVVSNAALELPVWLLTGVGLGVLFSGLVALAFVLGRRRFADGAAVGAGFGGDERRRREIRHYLEAIGEAYREEESVAGSTVAFYLPERELAITFDARAYFRIEEAGVDAVLLEHELPGANLGSRLPFETPTFGTREPSSGRATAAASAAGASSTGRGSSQGDPRGRAARERAAERRRVHAAFAALGLPPEADADAVHAAYRSRVKEVHPDHGGDPTQFQRVREAYELAADHLERA